MSESRIQLLLEELADISWDIVVVSETWRVAKREVLVLDCGHCWYSSGGQNGKCGVGFLVHRRLPRGKLSAKSERLAVLKGIHLGILGAYLPDSNHSDEEVETLCCQMDEQLERLRREKRSCLIAGDLNAQIGGLDELDDARTPSVTDRRPLR